MSDSLRVTLVVWRDASTDRPKDQNLAYVTDRGIGVIHPDKGVWIDMAYLLPFDPQPTVWCDPKPPGKGAATMGDLRLALAWGEGAYKRHIERRPRHFNPHIEAELQDEEPAKLKAFARLRAALDAASEETEEA